MKTITTTSVTTLVPAKSVDVVCSCLKVQKSTLGVHSVIFVLLFFSFFLSFSLPPTGQGMVADVSVGSLVPLLLIWGVKSFWPAVGFTIFDLCLDSVCRFDLGGNTST